MFSVFSLFRFVNLCLLSSSRLVVLCFFRWQIWWWRVTTVAVEEMDVVDQLAGSVGSGSGSAGPSRFGWIWICCWGEGRRLWGSGDDGRKQWWRGLGLVLSGEGEWGGKIVWLERSVEMMGVLVMWSGVCGWWSGWDGKRLGERKPKSYGGRPAGLKKMDLGLGFLCVPLLFNPKIAPQNPVFSSLFIEKKIIFFQMLSKHLYLNCFSKNKQYQRYLDEENQ